MGILVVVLGSILFVGAVLGLTYILTLHTRRDADRWLADRRISQRRTEPDARPTGDLPERRKGERRKDDPQRP